MARTAPEFTAEELPTGTPIGSVEELEALPEWAVVVLVEDEHGFIDEDLYVKTPLGWSNADIDSEREFTDDDMWVIATIRDHRQIIHVWSPGQDLVKITSDTIEDVPDRAFIIDLKPGNVTGSFYRNSGGLFYESAPADPHEAYGTTGSTLWGYTADRLHTLWIPPVSKTG